MLSCATTGKSAKETTPTQPRVCRTIRGTVMGSLFAFQHAPQNLTPLPSLPDLVGILVLVEIEELLVSLQRWLRLVQIIVTERADEPTPCPGSFEFINPVEECEGRGIVFGKIVCGTEILPIIHFAGVELDRGFEFFFGVGKIAHLQICAP